jgi:drug/metabolite transporter (DMT)-like permease
MGICANSATPVVLAIGAAFLFALGIQFTRKGLRHIDSRTGTLVSIGTATLLYWAVSPWLLERHYWMSPAIALFAAIGLFRPFLSSNLSMAGTRYLGATISSTLASASPVFGVALGVLLLGEYLGLEVALGTAAIVTGVVVLSWRDDVSRAWPWWALTLPIGAACLRSVAQAFAKLGMESLPSPYFVGLVGYSVSFLVADGPQSRLRLAGVDRRELRLGDTVPEQRARLRTVVGGRTNRRLRTVVHAASGRFPVSRAGGHRACGARCAAGCTRGGARQHGQLIADARREVRIPAHDASLVLEPFH